MTSRPRHSYVVNHASDKVVETSSTGGFDTVTSFLGTLSSSFFTLPNNVENLVLGGNGNIGGAGNSLDNFIAGNPGNNMLRGGAGNDRIDALFGNDTLDGGTGDDVLIAGDVEGTDTGVNLLIGGDGNDHLSGGAQLSDTLIGGAGDDFLLVDEI